MDLAETRQRLSSLVVGDRRTVAACLNDVEDERPRAVLRARTLERELEETGLAQRAHRVGITGPPGVGKSSLVAGLARALRQPASGEPRTVGVLAVDPSSTRSGGALLGDRVRIASDGSDAGLFIRSLATRGTLGGLARALPGEVVVLAAAFDVVLVETVGVGQSESDVRDVVDTLLFVVQPGAGDTLQHLKAGIMEAPDLFVVNKADTGLLANRTRSELKSALASLAHAGLASTTSAVVSTSARDGTGLAELVSAIDAHRHAALAVGDLERRRRSGRAAQAFRAFVRRYGELGVERVGGESVLRATLEARLASGDDVALRRAWTLPLWRASNGRLRVGDAGARNGGGESASPGVEGRARWRPCDVRSKSPPRE